MHTECAERVSLKIEVERRSACAGGMADYGREQEIVSAIGVRRRRICLVAHESCGFERVKENSWCGGR
jgi:hypothetical protein